MIESFKLLVFILRDLLFLSLEREDAVLNLDYKNKFLAFLQKYPAFQIQRAIDEVEQAVDFIYKNVYLDAVVFSLNQSIFKCLDQD